MAAPGPGRQEVWAEIHRRHSISPGPSAARRPQPLPRRAEPAAQQAAGTLQEWAAPRRATLALAGAAATTGDDQRHGRNWRRGSDRQSWQRRRGRYGDGRRLGDGGGATAASVTSTIMGGTGGIGRGGGFAGGAGGIPNVNPISATSTSGSATVAVIDRRQWRRGERKRGGRCGGAASLLDDVNATTSGNVTLTQTAVGGNGGTAVAVNAGSGGDSHVDTDVFTGQRRNDYCDHGSHRRQRRHGQRRTARGSALRHLDLSLTGAAAVNATANATGGNGGGRRLGRRRRRGGRQS